MNSNKGFADGRLTKMYFVSRADLCVAARTPVAFLNSPPGGLPW